MLGMTAAFLFLLLLIIFTGCSQINDILSAKGTVTGRVVDDQNNGLPSATVSCESASTQTNSGGYFTLDEVPIGQRTVNASLSGYFNDGRGSKAANVIEDGSDDVGWLTLVPTIIDGPNRAVYLWHLDESSSDFWKAQGTLMGASYFDSLVGGTRVTEDVALYSIGQRYSRFRSTVGVSDFETNLNGEVVFQVYGDGVLLVETAHTKVGTTASIDVNVTGVLTLQLKAYHVAGTGNDENIDVVWGNARLLIP